MPTAKETPDEDYRVPFGKNQGTRLGDLSDESLEWYATVYNGPNETLRKSAQNVLDKRADEAREIGCEWPDDPSDAICAGNPSDYGDS